MRGHRFPREFPAILVALAATLAGGAARAERADRGKPITIQSDGSQPGNLDLNRRTAVLTGNVVVTQGTLEIHADRVEVGSDAAGPRTAVAIGSPASPVRFRQKGDRPDEWSEGEAARIEYDGAANRVRFVGDARFRVLHGTTVTDDARAALVTYDIAAGTIVTGGGGRQTLVLAPPAAASAP